MKAHVQLSTHVLTTQNAHQVGVLVTLSGEAPSRRAPINVALVLDRSGSMAGEPLRAAKQAALKFAGFLGAEDRLTVVAFDDQVETVFGPSSPNPPIAQSPNQLPPSDAILAIESRGSTNLSGGWLMGQRQVRSGLVDGTNRVVLLTDGAANVGVVDPAQLAGLAEDSSAQRVSTSCIGFGPQFNENLLSAMARSGRGNYWYVENSDQMAAIFSEEIEGLVTLLAQNVEIEVRPRSSRVAGVSLLQGYPMEQATDGAWRVTMGDLYASSPLVLGLKLHVEDVALLGNDHLVDLIIRSDAITEHGIEQRTVTLPVEANLDGRDHPEPEVEKTFLRFEVARARGEAVRQADQGDLDGAAGTLRDVAALLIPYASADAQVRELRDDLSAEAARFHAREFRAEDRKYHMARGMAEAEGKGGYVEKVARRRKGKGE